MLATGFAYDVHETDMDNVNNFKNFLKQARAVRRPGSAAIDLCYVAAGRFDGFWEFNLHPWDVAAGVLLIQEAGGRVTNMAGESYSIYSNNILASNRGIHRDMVNVLCL